MTTKLFDSFETLYNYLKPKVKSIKDTKTKKALAKEVKTSFKKEGFDTRAIKLGDSPQDVIKHAIESKPLSSINKTTGTVKRYLKTAKELYKKYNLVINAIASVVAVGAAASILKQKSDQEGNVGEEFMNESYILRMDDKIGVPKTTIALDHPAISTFCEKKSYFSKKRRKKKTPQ